MPTNRHRWTQEELNKLKTLMNTKTWDQIGVELGVSPESARKKAKELGFKKKNLTRSVFGWDIKASDYSDEHGIRAACDKYGLTVDEVKNARRRVRERREKVRESLSGDRAIGIRKACFKAALENGFGHLQEDFASWALVYLLEGYYATIDQLASYYKSTLIGTGQKKDSLGNRAKASEYYSEGLKEEDDPTVPGDLAVAPIPKAGTKDVYQFAESLKLSQLQHIVFTLRFAEGMNRVEISRIMGTSMGQVQYILRCIEDILIKNMPLKTELLD